MDKRESSPSGEAMSFENVQESKIEDVSVFRVIWPHPVSALMSKTIWR
jgi:hypothetical protein